jgi:hypothetical protein
MTEFKSYKGLHQQWQTKRAVGDLVVAEAPWLAQTRPDVVYRHASGVRELAYYLKLLRDPNLDSGTLQNSNRTVIGLGSIVADITVEHPTEGQRQGRLIDYWMRKDVDQRNHLDAVRSMATYQGYGGLVLAAMTEAELDRAGGIPELMEPVGEPGRLTVLSDKGYGLETTEEPLQLFAMEIHRDEA